MAPLRRGTKKVQSSQMVDWGVLNAALAKTNPKGEMVRRKSPVMQTIFIVAVFSALQGDRLGLAPNKEIDYFQHPAKFRLKQIETVKKNLQCRRLPAVHAVWWIDNIVVDHHPPDEEDQQRRDEEVCEARPEHPKFLERIWKFSELHIFLGKTLHINHVNLGELSKNRDEKNLSCGQTEGGVIARTKNTNFLVKR